MAIRVCLSTGHSGLITDCVITKGNPADTSLTCDMLDRQTSIAYSGAIPSRLPLDGGFASKENLKAAKGQGDPGCLFCQEARSQGGGYCTEASMSMPVSGDFGREWRQGSPGSSAVSGLTSVPGKGLRSFRSYVWASLVTANLVTMTRHLIASEGLDKST